MPPVNRVRYLYELFNRFTKLSRPQQFVIGMDLNILGEEDAYALPTEIEEQICESVIKETKYISFLIAMNRIN